MIDARAARWLSICTPARCRAGIQAKVAPVSKARATHLEAPLAPTDGGLLPELRADGVLALQRVTIGL